MTQEGTPNRGILNGTHPNPNLQVHRRGPNTNKRTREGQPIAPHPGPPPPQSPSLVAHLLNRFQGAFTAATQQPFLSHAGCGTLFIGNMLAKLRLPVVPNSQFHQTYRVMDLLISALNNIRREMTFFEITATKFGLQMTEEPPNRITRAYLDLFMSSTSSGASLLEGMVVLWATEHQLIPNWTSAPFSKFVDACRSLVDELANTTTSPNGKEEMIRCEQLFEHVCWLEERFWPDVDGMGEEDETARLATHGGHHSASGAAHTHPTHSMTGGVGSGMGGNSTPNMGMSVNTGLGSGMGGMETPSRDSGNSFTGALNGIAEAANGTPGS
ncbi:Transcription regulator [Neofusicoccum parvum]|uniref:Putative transcription regulator protein n=1 Tax=Botryosphaeria parva (strain UCR-NP2) TaxID=1287680 RepID=R1GEB6_BOTPV|nr:putative transcription regulator protein [Neofusicoccum parvum UCRNP2]GME47292.1 Transcription regulator [Neofusicoccum parvum]